MARKRVTVFWLTKDKKLRRSICKHFGCKYAETVNGHTRMDIRDEDWEYFLKGEEKGLYDQRHFENLK